MFDSNQINDNNKLIKECEKLIIDHNKISYKQVSLNIPSISFEMINPNFFKFNDPLSAEIIDMYENYLPQMIAVSKLKKIIDMIEYTNEDLSIHINQSSDSIVQIFSSLSHTRMKLIKLYDVMTQNLTIISNSFVNYFYKLITKDTNLAEIINTVFICMKQHGLSDKVGIDMNERYFIHIGIKLIGVLHKSNLLTSNHVDLIKTLNDDLKQVILSVDNRMHRNIAFNRLQTFGLTPDEGSTFTLKYIIQKLFGLKIDNDGSLSDLNEHLSKILKLYEADTGLSIGLIIIVSPNQDTYFDMTSLGLISNSNTSSGINEETIKLFDLIKQGNKPSANKSDLITIGINPEQKQSAYVLWTNDLKTFKLKTKSIDSHLIKKIIRNDPSTTIEAYNNKLEKAIVNNRTEDIISFNRVKYMSFNDTITEEVFLKKFQAKIVLTLINAIGKLEGVKLQKAIVEDKFTNELLDSIDAAKNDIGIHPQLLSSHCHIIYASMATSIVYKLKKELILHDMITKTELKDIVKGIVETNDNIYSRVIASYYLHIA